MNDLISGLIFIIVISIIMVFLDMLSKGIFDKDDVENKRK